MKKVTISGKPTARTTPTSCDEWVSSDSSRPEESPKPLEAANEKIKRLTIDIPLSLHQRVKSQCALRGENMADVVRAFLEKHFPEENKDRPPHSASAKE